MRSYLDDMQALLSEKLPTTDYIAGVEAAKIVEWLRDNDPDLLHGWLNEIAVVVMSRTIATRSNRDRGDRRKNASVFAFSAAATRFAASGDPSEFSPFLEQFVVNSDNLRRIVADMTREDHTFVANRYNQRSEQQKAEAAFHKVIADRIGSGQTTSDVMDEDTYQRLHDSIIEMAV